MSQIKKDLESIKNQVQRLNDDNNTVEDNDGTAALIKAISRKLTFFPTICTPQNLTPDSMLQDASHKVIENLEETKDIISSYKKLANNTISKYGTISIQCGDWFIKNTNTNHEQDKGYEKVLNHIKKLKLLEIINELLPKAKVEENVEENHVKNFLKKLNYKNLETDIQYKLAIDTNNSDFAAQALSTDFWGHLKAKLSWGKHGSKSYNLTAEQLVDLLLKFHDDKTVVNTILSKKGWFSGQNYWKKIKSDKKSINRLIKKLYPTKKNGAENPYKAIKEIFEKNSSLNRIKIWYETYAFCQEEFCRYAKEHPNLSLMPIPAKSSQGNMLHIPKDIENPPEEINTPTPEVTERNTVEKASISTSTDNTITSDIPLAGDGAAGVGSKTPIPATA